MFSSTSSREPTVRLREYQLAAIQHLHEHKRAALWARMGAGKTVVTLTALQELDLLEGDVFPALVVAPRRVAKRVWSEEVRKWPHLSGLTVESLVDLTPAARKAALQRARDAHITTVNFEQIPWLAEHVSDWPYRTIVVDEASKLRGFRGSVRTVNGKLQYRKGGTRRSSILGELALKTPRFIELTGTPSPNGVINLWGQLWFLDFGRRLGRTFTDFTDQWFSVNALPGGARVYYPKRGAVEQITAAVSDICLTVDPREALGAGEPVYNTVLADLPPTAAARYAEVEATTVMELTQGTYLIPNAAALTGKLLQFAAGAVYYENGAWEHIHDAKLEALDSVLEEVSEPIVLAYWWRHDRERLLDAIPDAVDLATPHGLDRFLRGEALVGLAHPVSVGHGVDGLQHVCRTVVFFTSWWDYELREQLIERVGPTRQKQAGYDRDVYVYDIVASGTVDEAVVQAVRGKKAVQDAVLDFARQRRPNIWKGAKRV